MSNACVFAPTDPGDEATLADWLEATMLAENCGYMPRAKIRRYIKSVLVADEPDLAVEVLLREISRRQRLCAGAYPFTQEDSGIKYAHNVAGTAYLFMLCISSSESYRSEKRQLETDELFDSLVLDALRQYLGHGSEGVRFGSPASGSRPKNFKDAIHWLAREMSMPMGTGGPRKTSGDGGLDVVAWRRFADRRTGYLVLLAQCTVQRDWFGKAKDLAEDAWRGWIDFGKDPHLALAIPFVISQNYNKWDDLRRLVHSALDRLRLCELLGGTALKAERAIQKWIAAEVSRMSATA